MYVFWYMRLTRQSYALLLIVDYKQVQPTKQSIDSYMFYRFYLLNFNSK